MSQASTSRIDLAGKYTRRLILSEVSNVIDWCNRYMNVDFPYFLQQTTKWKLWSIWIIFLRRQKLVVFLYYLVVVFIVFNCLCLLFTFVFKKILLLPLEMMIRHIICILSGWKNSSVPFSAHLLKRWWGKIGLKFFFFDRM